MRLGLILKNIPNNIQQEQFSFLKESEHCDIIVFIDSSKFNFVNFDFNEFNEHLALEKKDWLIMYDLEGLERTKFSFFHFYNTLSENKVYFKLVANKFWNNFPENFYY